MLRQLRCFLLTGCAFRVIVVQQLEYKGTTMDITVRDKVAVIPIYYDEDDAGWVVVSDNRHSWNPVHKTVYEPAGEYIDRVFSGNNCSVKNVTVNTYHRTISVAYRGKRSKAEPDPTKLVTITQSNTSSVVALVLVALVLVVASVTIWPEILL